MQSIVVFTLELSRIRTLVSQHLTHTLISAKNDFCCTVSRDEIYPAQYLSPVFKLHFDITLTSALCLIFRRVSFLHDSH